MSESIGTIPYLDCKEFFMHETIKCKIHTFSWQYLKYEITATIHYWSKYYTVRMLVPFDASVGTASLMYGIPTHYGIIESEEEKVGNTINLIPIAKRLCEQWIAKNEDIKGEQ